MAERIRVIYRTMRCSIPEGGEVVLHVPEHIGVESIDMTAECIALQMRSFRRHAGMVRPDVAVTLATVKPPRDLRTKVPAVAEIREDQ